MSNVEDGKSTDDQQVVEVIAKRREKQARGKERLIAREEVDILRARLRECAQREYINRIQNCQKEAKAYMDAFTKYRDGRCNSSVLFDFFRLFHRIRLLADAATSYDMKCIKALNLYTVQKEVLYSVLYDCGFCFAGSFQMCDVVEISDDEEELPQFLLGQCPLDNHVSTASSESSQEDLYTCSQNYILSSGDRRKVLGDHYPPFSVLS